MAAVLAFFWLAAAVSLGVVIGRAIRMADEREVRPEPVEARTEWVA
jgi:hypothetical protein